MMHLIPSAELIREVENSEIDYLTDRMAAIRSREGNPEGIEIERFGHAVCFYSRTMPWPTFNTVKGLTASEVDKLEAIIRFYKERERSIQFEIVPSMVDSRFLQRLTELGFYPSGIHSSLMIEPQAWGEDEPEQIRVHELREDQFELYAAIHCRGTGLPDNGIPHVAANNRVLYRRPGWKFFIAYVEEEPAAVGVMFIKNNTASLTFAATLPSYRNRGLHRSLLQRRIEEAFHQRCTLAVSQCAYLSQSHRNMERVGMKLAYVRTTWTARPEQA